MSAGAKQKAGSRKAPGRIRQAVILAGGAGRRLAPFTDVLPKPLMPVGERPIIDILTHQLARSGIREIVIALGAGAKLIKLFLGDGSALGVGIRYVIEKTPLGTAGPLRRIDKLDEQFLVLNGDLLTDIDFAEFARTHVASGALATIAVCKRRERADFGVVISKNGRVTEYKEKPIRSFEVSMGIYAFSREIIEHIPKGRFDFPELVFSLLKRGIHPHAYKFSGSWLDIGREEDWRRAAKALARSPRKYLK
ncbi:MAG: NDP-sugar synthase [Candidatus Zixiibacteriota bacterium]